MTFALIAMLLSAQASPPDRAPITVERYLGLRHIEEVRAEPDGAGVAFTVRSADLDASDYGTELYLWRPGGEARSITPGRSDVARPRWSPDGAWLAFTSTAGRHEAGGGDPDPEVRRQVWLLPMAAGGEARQLTDLPGGVLDFGWAPDGSAIYVLTRSVPSSVERALQERREETRNDAVTVRDAAERPREFRRVSVPDGEVTFLWGGDRGITEMAVSPDGGSIAYATNGSGFTGDYEQYDLWTLDIEGRSVRRLTQRHGAEVAPAWSPDGKRIVFQAPQDPDVSYSQTELFEIPATGGTPHSVTSSFDRTVLEHTWSADSDLVFSGALGMYTHLFTIRGSGAVERLTSGDVNYGSFDAAPDSTVYAVRESATEGEELYRIRDSQVERLTHLNDRVRDWRIAKQEVIQWTAPDGLAIEGLLVYPVDYQEGQRYPLLVNPHGGPSSRVRNVLDQSQSYQLFAAHGYAVLAPNFRGSTGFGEAFGTANRQDLGGGDFKDLMAGVDRVIEMGVADSTRIGIYGGSYGGYMTNWAITQTSRFAAAVSMYGIFNLITDYSNSNIPRWEYDYLRRYYWEDLDGYLNRSPMKYASRVRTPVLIIHGEEDPNTFIANSNEMYRALKDLGRTVEFVKYPREHHGISEPRHRVDLFFRQLRWFDRYLKFGGTNRFDFYLVDEWVPGSTGWDLRVVGANPRAGYAGAAPGSGRYLEVTLALRPDTAAAARGQIGALQLDLASGLRLAGPDSVRSPAGTVIDMFDQKTLVAGGLGSLQANAPPQGKSAALAVAVAFRIPDSAAEYLLQADGFAPVRIWVPRAGVDGGPEH